MPLTSRITIAAALLAVAAPLAAQQRFTGGPVLRAAHPLGTMGEYLDNAAGFGFAFQPPGALPLRVEAGLLRFATRTAARTYNGQGTTPIDITSSARILLVVGGPQLSAGIAGLRIAAGLLGGAAHVSATGSTVLAGDPQQVQRANTYTTITWAGGVRGAVALPLGPSELAIDVAWLRLGETEFLREYNLPIGVISGIYLNPTPYPPAFVTAGLSLRVAL